VGGKEPGQGNIISFNELYGVAVAQQITGVRISGNSIDANGGLGIDLFASSGGGVTLNDAGDPDNGGNHLQNFPVLTAASSTSSQTTVAGTLNSTPNSTFALEFFANPSCDPTGFGEGKVFLGTITVTTDASGNAAFNAALPMGAPANSVATSTATNIATHDTSEFSACIPIAGTEPRAADLTGDGVVGPADLAQLLSHWGACAGCPADLNGDGAVGPADLAQLLSQWG
jgi:titin